MLWPFWKPEILGGNGGQAYPFLQASDTLVMLRGDLSLDGGKTVDIAKCPEGHGKVKSPQCCGADMSCAV